MSNELEMSLTGYPHYQAFFQGTKKVFYDPVLEVHWVVWSHDNGMGDHPWTPKKSFTILEGPFVGYYHSVGTLSDEPLLTVEERGLLTLLDKLDVTLATIPKILVE